MVAGSTCPDNPDSPQHHEVLLPGFLYGMIIKERFDECLGAVGQQIRADLRRDKAVDFASGMMNSFKKSSFAVTDRGR